MSDEELREVVLDGIAGVVWPDRANGRGERRTGIKHVLDAHDRDAGFALTVDHGAMHWRSAAIFGQERGVHVDHAESRKRKERFRDQLAIRGDHTEVDLPRAQCRLNLWILELVWLQHGEVAVQGHHLDGRVGHPLTPASCAIRLGHDAAHLMARCDQGLQGGDGELWRAEKGNAEGRGHHLPERDSFLILRTINVLRNPRSRSTKSVPSRWSSSC